MVDVYQSQTLPPPWIGQRTEQLLASVFGTPDATQNAGESDEDFQLRKFGRAGVSQQIPGFQFAGFSPEQQQAFQLASSGIGGYAPYLQQAGTQAGLASSALQGAQQAYDPTTSQAYMDPYQQQVTDQALQQYDVQGQQARNQLAGQAARGGAFGGTRYGLQEAELGKNLQDVKSRRIFEDLSRNYQQAQQASMGAFEAQQRRQLGAGQQYGQLAKTQAGLGALHSQLGQADIQSLLGIGGMKQQLGQGILEANRQQQLMAQQEPFRRLSWAGDILGGVPSGQQTYTQQPQTNPYAQAMGLGIAGLGAMGQYGQSFPNSGLGQFMGNLF